MRKAVQRSGAWIVTLLCLTSCGSNTDSAPDPAKPSTTYEAITAAATLPSEPPTSLTSPARPEGPVIGPDAVGAFSLDMSAEQVELAGGSLEDNHRIGCVTFGTVTKSGATILGYLQHGVSALRVEGGRTPEGIKIGSTEADVRKTYSLGTGGGVATRAAVPNRQGNTYIFEYDRLHRVTSISLARMDDTCQARPVGSTAYLCEPGLGFPSPAPACPDPDPLIGFVERIAAGTLEVQPVAVHVTGPEGEAWAKAHGVAYPFDNDHYEEPVGPKRSVSLAGAMICTWWWTHNTVRDGVVGCDQMSSLLSPHSLIAVWYDGNQVAQISGLFRP